MNKQYTEEETNQVEITLRVMREGLEWEYFELSQRWEQPHVGSNVIDFVKGGFPIRLTPYSQPVPPDGMEYQNPESIPLTHESFRGMRLLVKEEYDGRYCVFTRKSCAKSFTAEGEVQKDSMVTASCLATTYCVPRDTPFPSTWAPRFKVGDRVVVKDYAAKVLTHEQPNFWQIASVPDHEGAIYKIKDGIRTAAFTESLLEPYIFWKLPSPPEGREWNNAEKWTENMLEGGWRPLMIGELLPAWYYFLDPMGLWRIGKYIDKTHYGELSALRKTSLPVSAARFEEPVSEARVEERVEEPEEETK